MSFVRPSKDYSFYGQTLSLCEVCLRLVNAKIAIEGDDVVTAAGETGHHVQTHPSETNKSQFHVIALRTSGEAPA